MAGPTDSKLVGIIAGELIINNFKKIPINPIFLVALLSFLLSKGLSLLPGYAVDDWIVIGNSNDVKFVLANGRFTQAAIEIFFQNIGIDSVSSAWVFTIGYFFVGAWALTRVVEFISGPTAKYSLVYVLIAPTFICHPYLTEYSTYRQAAVVLFLGFGLFGIAITLLQMLLGDNTIHNKHLKSIGLVISIILLLGINQTFILFISISVISMFASQLINNKTSIKESGTLKKAIDGILFLLTSIIIYLIIGKVIQKLVDVSAAPRMSLLELSNLDQRVQEILNLPSYLIIQSEPVLPFVVKILITLLAFSILIFAFAKKLSFGIIMSLLGLSIFAISISIISVSGVWWLVPRVLMGTSFAFMAFLTAGVKLIPKSLLKPTAFLLIFISGSLTLLSNQILSDQFRMNRWDLSTANAIFQEAKLLGAEPNQEFVLVMPPWKHPMGVKTIQGDLNISALSVNYAVPGLFKEATGRNVNVSVSQDTTLCSEIEQQLDDYYLKLVQNQVIVCF